MTELEYVIWLRGFVLYHSFLYYQANTSIISDQDFDKKAYELVAKQEPYKNKGRWHKVFNDFDGTTGHHLYDRLTSRQKAYVKRRAFAILKSYKDNEQPDKRSGK